MAGFPDPAVAGVSFDHRVPPQAQPDVVAVHATQIIEQDQFSVASCSCGWKSYARRSRPRARQEGVEHQQLHGA